MLNETALAAAYRCYPAHGQVRKPAAVPRLSSSRDDRCRLRPTESSPASCTDLNRPPQVYDLHQRPASTAMRLVHTEGVKCQRTIRPGHITSRSTQNQRELPRSQSQVRVFVTGQTVTSGSATPYTTSVDVNPRKPREHVHASCKPFVSEALRRTAVPDESIRRAPPRSG
jgi:hypothetical protein